MLNLILCQAAFEFFALTASLSPYFLIEQNGCPVEDGLSQR